jgi:hypothetical protein
MNDRRREEIGDRNQLRVRVATPRSSKDRHPAGIVQQACLIVLDA